MSILTECYEEKKEMDSVAIETLGCLLDIDLLKSPEHFNLESSNSYTFSDNSNSDDEETEIKNDDLIEQLKNLSFYDVPHSKKLTSKCSNNNFEASSQEKDGPEKLEYVKNKEIDGNKPSSSIKNKEFLNFVVKSDAQSTFCKCSNKNCEINSKKKNNSEKLNYVDNLENVENQLSSLSLKNDKLSNKYYKSDSGISTWGNSDTDDDDDEQVEPVILRERYPTKHNRTENNKQKRTTPFSPNHTRTHYNLNNSQTFQNHILDDFNACNGGYDSINYIIGTDFEIHENVSISGRTFDSGFSTLEPNTDETSNVMVSSILVDQETNNIIPCTEENQIVKGIVPLTLTDQINDVIPYISDEVHDSIVPCVDDTGNANDKFCEEINDISCFDNLKERIFPSCAVTSVQKDSFLRSAEDVVNIVKYLNPRSGDLSIPNHLDLLHPINRLSGNEVEHFFNNSPVLNQNTCNESIIKKTCHTRNNQHNLHPEPDHRQSFLTKANVVEPSLFSDLNEVNNILETSSHFQNSECLVKKSDNFSNWDRKNESLISCESLSSTTSDHRVISNENEDVIAKWEEIKEWLNKGDRNGAKRPCEISCNVILLDESGNNTNLDSNNLSENNNTHKGDGPKRNNSNQTNNPPCKSGETRIYTVFGSKAKHKLFHDSSFCKSKWEDENRKIREQIANKNDKLGTEEKKVIHFLKRDRKTKYKGTNLHRVIQSENTEKAFCIVECHKEFHDDLFEINFRDSLNKTVLDYSKEKGMDLLSDYLEENNAKPCIYLYK